MTLTFYASALGCFASQHREDIGAQGTELTDDLDLDTGSSATLTRANQGFPWCLGNAFFDPNR